VFHHRSGLPAAQSSGQDRTGGIRAIGRIETATFIRTVKQASVILAPVA
jgi:hypothetical protein